MQLTSLLLLSSLGTTVLGNHHHPSHPQPTSLAPGLSLQRRADSTQHKCGPDQECDNGACCGPSNVCGFGPVYCGDGCQSNCKAKAPCGQYAEEPGAECPLKVCCSEFGFCGTTEEFCSGGCQSNCGNVSRPDSGVTDVRQNVIGYYEMWRANGDSTECSLTTAMIPELIPVEALDQLNVAFIYINPDDYSVANMDEVPDSLYHRLADTKTRNPSLKVWVSVGGWKFNNDAYYPSMLTDIAASTAKTKQFAKGLLDFMNNYGFDGVDLDWEYPGAEDRGGRKVDVENYPKMLQKMRRFFDVHGGSKEFGISITVPTSYWYLRWFDVSALTPHIDSFNLMAYDLHGTWDRNNPIGNYVYAHTNLTEIDLALDLFWRNDVPSGKINLGLAFYGRTFELNSTSCDEAGCPFKGPGPKGECTNTKGILSYTEILHEMDEAGVSIGQGITYDEDAAVYYFNYGKGGKNWMSFDDSVSFKAKIDLANQRGLGGMYIWALDQDDSSLHALKAVTGKNYVPTPSPEEGFGAFDMNDCYITDCGESCSHGDTTMVRLNEDENGNGCSEGFTGDSQQRSSPDSSTCKWRGEPNYFGVCHANCEIGEVTMAQDDFGGSGSHCDTGGQKAWCCPATNGQKAIQHCALSNYDEDCPDDRPQELTRVSPRRLGVRLGEYAQKFCCPADPEYSNCGWHGEETTCDGNTCPVGQVELFNWNGRHSGPPSPRLGCWGGSKASFCCDPPLSGGSPFLPVPLENLFPTANKFSHSVDTIFNEVIDNSQDDPDSSTVNDPNDNGFAWMVMVGEEEDVQSFSKRDGSHLELFDCPDTHPDDYSVQKVRAVCTGGSDSNCEDITKGGVEGTVVRLPSHCGPNEWVRAVHFERSTNTSIPGHLQKRTSEGAAVYDFHYDYEFHLLRRDGGEIYFRADMSTHPGYYKEIVEDTPGSPVKRDASNWRSLDRRWWAENDKESWRKRFQNMLKNDKSGLKKHYEYSQCLMDVSAQCKQGTVQSKASVYGKLDTTMDMGMSFIGTLRNFAFSEAYSFFGQKDFNATMGVGVEAYAKMQFSSGYVPVGSFDSFGGNYFIKGIFKVNPYYQVEAQVQADIILAAQATAEVAIYHPRYWYFLPDTMSSSMPEQPAGNFDLTATSGPVAAIGDITAKTGGNLAVSLRPTIGVDIGLYIPQKKTTEDLMHTSIKLSTQADFEFGVAASAGTSCTGIDLSLKADVDVQLDVQSAISEWNSNNYTFNAPKMRQVYEDCLPLPDFSKRSIDDDHHLHMGNTSLARRAAGLDIPDSSSSTCAFSTRGVYCAEDETEDSPSPKCDINDLSDDDDDEEDRISVIKRSGKPDFSYCRNPRKGDTWEGFLDPADESCVIRFPTFPSSGDLVEKKGVQNVVSYDGLNWNDCNDYSFGVVPTPAKPGTDKRVFASEHVLEVQMLPQFFQEYSKRWSNLEGQKTNPDARSLPDPLGGTDELTFCEYMPIWWGFEGSRGERRKNFIGNDYVAKAYPSNEEYIDEWILLPGDLNSGTKAGWFSGTTLAGTTKLEKCKIGKEKYNACLRVLKKHILVWKYLGTPEIQTTLIKQVNRVADRLKKAENGLLEHHLRNAPNSRITEPYKPLELADEWNKWVKRRYAEVEDSVYVFLDKWTNTFYDMNRPQNQNGQLPPGQRVQKNKDVIKMMENLQSEFRGLQRWNINWDRKDTNGDPIM
ncbi:hypothetical protein MW887_008162 [Aspergillus wentii]|nr:hypothetical protein MW887_008162 [Aspergillus wentii]